MSGHRPPVGGMDVVNTSPEHLTSYLVHSLIEMKQVGSPQKSAKKSEAIYPPLSGWAYQHVRNDWPIVLGTTRRMYRNA